MRREQGGKVSNQCVVQAIAQISTRSARRRSAVAQEAAQSSHLEKISGRRSSAKQADDRMSPYDMALLFESKSKPSLFRPGIERSIKAATIQHILTVGAPTVCISIHVGSYR